MLITIVKTIFIPTQEYIQINIDTIKEWIMICNTNTDTNNDNIYSVNLCGYVKKEYNDDFIESIELIRQSIQNKLNINIINNTINENKGKINIINEMNRLDTIVLYIEHDIYPNDINIDIITSIFNLMNNDGEIQYVAFDQDDDSRHNVMIYDSNTEQYNYSYYVCSDDMIRYGYIATGCMVFRPTKYDLTSDNIYGDEDYIIGQYAFNNNMKVYVIDEKIRHVKDIDSDYSLWKRNKIYDIFVNKINGYDNFYL